MDETTTKGKVLPLSKGPNGEMNVVYCDGKGVSVGTLLPVQENKPLMGDYLFSMGPANPDSPVRDVEVTSLRGDSSGPPRVCTKAYAEGWDRIFGKKSEEDNKTLS